MKPKTKQVRIDASIHTFLRDLAFREYSTITKLANGFLRAGLAAKVTHKRRTRRLIGKCTKTQD